MSKPICVVFADAFAYGSMINLESIGKEYKIIKLNPGIGYSSNLHYLLFEGKTPDNVGFFTDYYWEKSHQTKINQFLTKCDEIDTLNNVYRVIRRKFTNKNDNIFFSENTYFSNRGKYKFMQDEPCYVFGQKCNKVYESTTNQSFEKAMNLMKTNCKNIVVVLEELDHIGHEVGYLGEKYTLAAKNINIKTKKLFDEFVKKYSNGICILISDHGMSYVNCSINILSQIKKKFGLPGEKYQIYADSVYLRIWSENLNFLKEIKQYLSSISVLKEIDEKLRKKHGVLEKFCGDLMYVLQEGYCFDPNSFGVAIRGTACGVHGYMEKSDSASGVIVINSNQIDSDSIDAQNVYKKIKSIIEF